MERARETEEENGGCTEELAGTEREHSVCVCVCVLFGESWERRSQTVVRKSFSFIFSCPRIYTDRGLFYFLVVPTGVVGAVGRFLQEKIFYQIKKHRSKLIC